MVAFGRLPGGIWSRDGGEGKQQRHKDTERELTSSSLFFLPSLSTTTGTRSLWSYRSISLRPRVLTTPSPLLLTLPLLFVVRRPDTPAF